MYTPVKDGGQGEHNKPSFFILSILFNLMYTSIQVVNL